jgi:uncharacterized membrane protein (UPF0127 family)
LKKSPKSIQAKTLAAVSDHKSPPNDKSQPSKDEPLKPKSRLPLALRLILREFKWFFILAAAYLILRMFFILLSFVQPASTKESKVTLNGHIYSVLTAVTDSQRQQGLMNYHKPVKFDGMQFLFPSSQIATFWNRNTHLDLTVYWLQGDKVIGQADLPAVDHSGLQTIRSPQPVDRVVEIIK